MILKVLKKLNKMLMFELQSAFFFIADIIDVRFIFVIKVLNGKFIVISTRIC